MRQIAYFFILFLFLGGSALAGLNEGRRRTEEKSRSSLSPTEAVERPHVSSGSPQVQPPQAESLPPKKETDRDYLNRLSRKTTATFKDACQVLAILLGEQKRRKDFSEQVAFLKEQKILPAAIAVDPEEPFRKGLAASMFCRALDIKGGILLRLFNTSQRYALAELVYEGIMEPGSTYEIISGKELVDAFCSAAEYQIAKIQEQKK